MVALGNDELLPRGITLFHTLLRAIEDGRYAQHRDDREHLRRAAVVDRSHQHLGQIGVHRKHGQFAAQWSEFAYVVQSAYDPELVFEVFLGVS